MQEIGNSSRRALRTLDPAVGDEIEAVLLNLLAYCRSKEWAGYDPYDALNSKLLELVPLLDTKIPRLLLTQALKRSPINLRSSFLIPKTQNPKALALFLAAFVKLANVGSVDSQTLIHAMIERLIALRSKNTSYWCWGYSFPWQTRTIIVPSGAPNLVCTTFVADALLDVYELKRDVRCLEMAASAASYVLDELYWTDGREAAGFGYPLPSVRNQVHNANLLAAALLARVHTHTGERKLLDTALRAARYSASRQLADGAWAYGEAKSQQWIDNFHTGFNLCALQSIRRHAETDEFEPHVRRGFAFYRKYFYCEDGTVKYFHNRKYPIDIHCVAQSIITPLSMDEVVPDRFQLANSVFQWAKKHMWDERGFFYYRVLRACTIRTSYMRWSQAWMTLALSSLLNTARSMAYISTIPDEASTR